MFLARSRTARAAGAQLVLLASIWLSVGYRPAAWGDGDLIETPGIALGPDDPAQTFAYTVRVTCADCEAPLQTMFSVNLHEVGGGDTADTAERGDDTADTASDTASDTAGTAPSSGSTPLELEIELLLDDETVANQTFIGTSDLAYEDSLDWECPALSGCTREVAVVVEHISGRPVVLDLLVAAWAGGGASRAWREDPQVTVELEPL